MNPSNPSSSQDLPTEGLAISRVLDLQTDLDQALDFAVLERIPEALLQWDRYEVLSFLGQGGMARVYRARDRKLNRLVALKFIREENAMLAQRLTLEAQLQASLDHDHIAKVFETGEYDGKPFIAMQLVQGDTLDRVAVDDLRVRVELLAQVARALDFAHCQGLVHRDLKPSNVMVESAGGRLKPYLMDFGLAKLADVPGQTLVSTVMGTLAYMAPEQAEGGRPLDFRTDVHALGAMLYEFLSGHPPFMPQKTTAHGEIVRRLLLEEAVPPSRKDPSVPRDLETIALKCLEKDPGRRYPTAAAVARELDCWLEGRPILARPAGLLERAFKAGRRVHQNPQAWRITQVAGLTLAVLAGTGAWALWRARSRAEFVANAGLLLTKVDDLLRTSAMDPVHDTRPDRVRAQALLMEIQHGAALYGTVADGPLAYAQGRCRLALHRYEEARADLERAWSLGFQGPQVAASLGLALGEVYRLRLRALEGETDPQRRKDRAETLKKTLQEPALAYLARGQGGLEDREYLAGLADAVAGRHAQLLARMDRLLAGEPLSLRYLKLKGEAEQGLAAQADEAGDHAQAMARERAAAQVLRQALDVARSDREGWLDLARVGEGLIFQSHFVHQDGQEGYGLGLEACAMARRLDPGDPEPLLAQARLLRSLARGREGLGQDPAPQFREGVALGEEALRMDPANADAWQLLALLNWSLANHALVHHQPVTALLAGAETQVGQCLRLRPGDVTAVSLLLDITFDQCQDRMRRGEDVLPTLDAAADVARKGRELDPGNYRIQSLSVILGIQRGMLRAERGQDPLPDFGLALSLADGILATRPQAHTALINRCLVLRVRAQHKLRIGVPFAEDLEASIATGRQVVAVHEDTDTLVNLGQALCLKGDALVQAGQDPMAVCGEGLALTERAVALDRNNPDGWADLLDLHLVIAAWRLKQGHGAESAFQACHRDLVQLARLSSLTADQALVQARLLVMEAGQARASGRSPANLLRQALAGLAGLPAGTQTAEHRAMRAKLLGLLAEASPGPGAAPMLLEAKALGQEALRQNPHLKRDYVYPWVM